MAAAAARAAAARVIPWVQPVPWGCPTCGKLDNFPKHKWCGNNNCRASRPPPPPTLGSSAAWPPIVDPRTGKPKPKKKAKRPSKRDSDNPAAAAAVEGETQTTGETAKTEITSDVLQGLNNMLQQCRALLPKADPLTGAFQKRLEDARAEKQAQQPAGLRLRNAESKLASKQRHHDSLETRLAEQKAATNKTEAELAKAAGEVETISKEVALVKSQLAAEAPPETNSPKEIKIQDLQAQLPDELQAELSGPLAVIVKALHEFQAKQATAAAQAEAARQQSLQPVPMEDGIEIFFEAGAEACKRAAEVLATGDREAFKKLRSEQRQSRRPAPYHQGGSAASAAPEAGQGK